MDSANIVGVTRVDAARTALMTAADEIDAAADTLAGDLADLLHQQIPELGADPAAYEETRRSSIVHIHHFVRAFRHGKRLSSIEPVPEALAFARAAVRRGVALSLVLRAYRLAHRFYFQAWEERLSAAGLASDVLGEATRQLVEMTFDFYDGLSQRLAAEYEREREHWLRGAHALRTETVRAILSGEVLDGDGASRVLGYELRRHHVGLVLWAQPVDGEETALAKLESAAAEIAGAIGCAQPLVVGVGRARVWGWAGTHGPHDTSALEAVVCARLDGISIGIGDPAAGVEGFRRTHRDAEDAARVAMLGGRQRGAVTLYRSVQLAAQMAGEIERTRRFVTEQLGPLAATDDEAVRLRATLEIYLEESGSRLHAAQRLGIHQNTVANRVKACRELLGRDLDNHGVELQVALKLAQTLGRAVLTETQ